ncbi:MAG: pectin acetylesterase-family hydrolase [Bacteroidota bacterium]
MTRFAPLALVCALTLTACDSNGTSGDPLSEAKENPGIWTWIDVDGAQCRDGSDTGFGIRIQEGATNLAIYLEGGGACFNGITCGLNDDDFTESDFSALTARSGNNGIFSTAASNPVGDWNMVYVPYCTGDVHGGTATDVTVPDVDGMQQFVGHLNIQRYLGVLQPNLDAPDNVLLTGASAGGFGALVNFAEVADTFTGSQMTLLDDSGPIFYDDDVFSPELGTSFIQLFGFQNVFPADAGSLFAPDGLQGVYDYYATRYPNANLGLTSYLEDDTIRFFFGFGQADGTITGIEYADGLRDVRATAPERWQTYYANGNEHTFIGITDRFNGSSAGVPLNEWLGDLLAGTAGDVDPDITTRPLAGR